MVREGVRESEQLHSFGVVAPCLTHPPRHRNKIKTYSIRAGTVSLSKFSFWSCGYYCDNVFVRGGFILIDQPIRLFPVIRSGGWNLMDHARTNTLSHHPTEWEDDTMCEYCMKRNEKKKESHTDAALTRTHKCNRVRYNHSQLTSRIDLHNYFFKNAIRLKLVCFGFTQVLKQEFQIQGTIEMRKPVLIVIQLQVHWKMCVIISLKWSGAIIRADNLSVAARGSVNWRSNTKDGWKKRRILLFWNSHRIELIVIESVNRLIRTRENSLCKVNRTFATIACQCSWICSKSASLSQKRECLCTRIGAVSCVCVCARVVHTIWPCAVHIS